MKKLLCLFGALGLLAFVAMPIYAQEEQEATLDEEIVAGADDIVAEAEDAVAGVEDFVYDVEETADDSDYGLIRWANEYDWEYTWDWDDSDYDYSYWWSLDQWTMSLLLWGLWLAWILFSFLAYVYWGLVILAQWEVYRKAGKKLWTFLIPFWWTMVYSEIAGIKKWTWILPWLLAIVPLFVASALLWWSGNGIKWVLWIVILVLSIATLIWWIVANYRVARRYGWGKFASILHVIFFPITVLVLWLWNYQYQWQVKKESETIVEA